MAEKTKNQVATKATPTGRSKQITPKKLRQARRDPTISLARKIFFAGIIVSEWTFESDLKDEGPLQYIKDQLEHKRRHILRSSVHGCFDFGWQPYELVYDTSDGAVIKLKKVKPLIQDTTEVLEDEDTGEFTGLKNGEAELNVLESLIIYWDGEGTDLKGESTLAIAVDPYEASQVVEDAAQRYDKKIAGAHWIVRHPDGSTVFNGVETPNHVVADSLLAALQSSGSISISKGREGEPYVDGEHTAWEIDLKAAPGSSASFVERLKYLDALKVRACGFPERTILEGQFGTKAEAEAHGDFLIILIEDRHQTIVDFLNKYVVNRLLEMQYGPEYVDSVVIKPAPLTDAHKQMLRSLYDKVLDNTEGFITEFTKLDIDSIANVLNVPRLANDPNKSAEDESVDPAVALNGAQVTALIEIATKAVNGEVDPEVAKSIAKVAFPSVPTKALNEIFDSIVVKQPAPVGTTGTGTGTPAL